MIITPAPTLPFLIFACDESSQSTDEYMVIGGLAFKSKREHEIPVIILPVLKNDPPLLIELLVNYDPC